MQHLMFTNSNVHARQPLKFKHNSTLLTFNSRRHSQPLLTAASNATGNRAKAVKAVAGAASTALLVLSFRPR